MHQEKVDFTDVAWGGVIWTNLCTLYLRAYESRAEHTILHDHFAAEALDRIEYDFDAMERKLRPRANQFLVALRAKQLDDWAGEFLARNPDSTVLHLGCGLDSRAFRLEPPPGVRWFDVDFPEVIDRRRELYPEHDGYRTIGSSVTDAAWLADIPSDRPALIIAEGVLMYLTEAETRQLLRRLTDHVASGELIFDGLSPLMARASKLFRWGIRDARQIERWNPRLHFVAECSMAANYDNVHVPLYRAIYRMMNSVAFARNMGRQFRFRF